MSITIRRNPNDRLLELGGGGKPLVHPTVMGGRDVNVDVRTCYNDQGQQTTDFAADFNEPLPLQDNEFDGVFSMFCLEHVSWRKVLDFLRESCRVLKPGCKAVFVIPNTEAQLRHIQTHPEGWDGKPLFESASCVLFGDQDYPENSHRAYFNPTLAVELFQRAGYERVVTQPYGTADTDMVVEAYKPEVLEKADTIRTTGVVIPNPTAKMDTPPIDEKLSEAFHKMYPNPNVLGTNVGPATPSQQPALPASYPVGLTAEQMFDRHYFDGGSKVGGYAGEGYRDFACHEVTARHILSRKPESVLELGAARGYVLKRIQDADVGGRGLEVSKHCYLTRVCDGIINHNLCQTPWPVDGNFDLCYSVATLEHIPEQHLANVIREMARTCKRGLHGIDFGERDDGFDKTHCSLFSKERWVKLFAEHAPGWPVEIVNKEELESGQFPADVLQGDGRLKVAIGTFTTMHHHGWINLDIHDLTAFAQANGYKFQRADVRQGLPFGTGVVDLLHMHHVLEHFTYADGLNLLRECRRVIRPDGGLRVAVPNASFLCGLYGRDCGESLSLFDEMNAGCAAATTAAGKLQALLCEGHAAVYDWPTLERLLIEAGFVAYRSPFRDTALGFPERARFRQILSETQEMAYGGISLFVDAVPKLT